MTELKPSTTSHADATSASIAVSTTAKPAPAAPLSPVDRQPRATIMGRADAIIISVSRRGESTLGLIQTTAPSSRGALMNARDIARLIEALESVRRELEEGDRKRRERRPSEAA